jgi:hypothetical protein
MILPLPAHAAATLFMVGAWPRTILRSLRGLVHWILHEALG